MGKGKDENIAIMPQKLTNQDVFEERNIALLQPEMKT